MREWSIDVALPADWSVGVIVRPSMAGKTTLAHELFPGELAEQGHWSWPADRCVAEEFSAGMSGPDIPHVHAWFPAGVPQSGRRSGLACRA